MTELKKKKTSNGANDPSSKSHVKNVPLKIKRDLSDMNLMYIHIIHKNTKIQLSV